MGPKKRTTPEGEKRVTRSSTLSPAKGTRSHTAAGLATLTSPLEYSPKKRKARTPTPKKEVVKAEEEVPVPPEVPQKPEEKPEAADAAAEEAQDEVGTNEPAKPEEDDAEKRRKAKGKAVAEAADAAAEEAPEEVGTNEPAKPEEDDAEKRRKAKGKAVAEADSDEKDEDNGVTDIVVKIEPVEEDDSAGAGKTVIIEFCSQSRSFKAKADEVKDALAIVLPQLTVLYNPEKKDRRGCFEVRDAEGFTYVSLLDMRRPFKPLKELDVDQVVADVFGKLG